MNKLCLLVLAVILINTFTIIAQDLPKVIPPSPEVSSLGKFTEVPISHYTGLPNISIPITSYSVGDKSFSVSLSYHARGIRVDEIASRVGIGWALNTGGSISRQLRHVADDDPFGYLSSSNILISALAATQVNQNFFSSFNVRENYRSFGQGNIEAYENIDRLPDVFNLQVGSLSAKFMMDYRNPLDPLIQKYDDIIISYLSDSSGRIMGFVVTDSQGYKFYFGVSKDELRFAQNWDEVMENISVPFNSGGPTITNNGGFMTYNTWQLMDIESPNGDLVSYIYELETSYFYRRSYDKKEGTNVISYSSKVRSYQYQLKEIIHRNGKITFQKSNTVRQDLNGGYALNSINIYDSHLSLIKSYQLTQSFKNSVNDNNQLPYLASSEPQAAKRMFLESVTEQGKNSNSNPPFVFTYNSQSLPNRFSNSQDYWGYYNGANNGQFLSFFDYGVTSVNRQVDSIKSMAGILESVKYPTGGSTKFIYEHNKGVLGNEYDYIVRPLINPTVSFSPNLGSLHYQDPNYFNGSVYSRTITIGPDKIGDLNYSVWFQDPTNCFENQVNNGCRFRVYLNGNGQSYDLFKGNHSILNITPGIYTLIVDPQLSQHNPITNSDDHFGVTLNWKEQQINENEYLFASGKRIKRIESYDANQSLETYKNYEYLNPNGDCSGVILSLPAFHSINRPLTAGPYVVLDLIGAVSGSPLSTYQGNTIGYTNVTEYYGDTNNNIGKTNYLFLVQKDTGDFITYPSVPPTDNEWLRGLPYQIINYKNNGNGGYKKVRKTENLYLYGSNFINNNPATPALIPDIFTPMSASLSLNADLTNPDLLYLNSNTQYRLPLVHLYNRDSQAVVNGDFDYKIYHMTGGALDTYSTTETIFDDNENPTISSYIENKFNYNKHYQISSVLSTTSDNKSMIQSYTYPQDITGSNTVETDLKNQNRLVPLEIKSYEDINANNVGENSELLSTTKTIYAWENSVLEPLKIQTSKGVSSLEDRIVYHKYDVYGHPLEVSKADGVHIVYIWGYNQSQPIAMIENLDYASIPTQTITNLQSLSDSDNDRTLGASGNEGALRIALNALRASYPEAMVSTYTYDPLVGVTSMTDAKGYTMYYEYDEFNRLKQVKDADGKILNETMYHYKQ